MTFVACVLFLSVIICFIVEQENYNNNKKNGRRLKTKKKTILILIFNVLGTTCVENLSSMSFHQELLR